MAPIRIWLPVGPLATKVKAVPPMVMVEDVAGCAEKVMVPDAATTGGHDRCSHQELEPVSDVAEIERHHDIAVVVDSHRARNLGLSAIAQKVAVDQVLLLAQRGRDEGYLLEARTGNGAVGSFKGQVEERVRALRTGPWQSPMMKVRSAGSRSCRSQRMAASAIAPRRHRLFQGCRGRGFGVEKNAQAPEGTVRHRSGSDGAKHRVQRLFARQRVRRIDGELKNDAVAVSIRKRRQQDLRFTRIAVTDDDAAVRRNPLGLVQIALHSRQGKRRRNECMNRSDHLLTLARQLSSPMLGDQAGHASAQRFAAPSTSSRFRTRTAGTRMNMTTATTARPCARRFGVPAGSRVSIWRQPPR